MEWQPIETCPKAGERFLAFDGFDICAVCYVADCGEIIVSWDGESFGEATHWAEIPKPPKQ